MIRYSGKGKCCCYLVANLCLTLWDPMNSSRPDFPVLHYLPEFAQTSVLHYLPEFAQTHVHRVGDDILIILFSFCLQSFPASGSSLMSQPFPSGGQNIGPSASVSVLPMNIQG